MSDKNQYIYKFNVIHKCDMCGSDVATHKILGQRLNLSQGFKPKSKIGISTTIMKCNNCNLIYANPLPIPNKIEDHYGVPADDYWKPDYFEIDRVTFPTKLKLIKELLPFKQGMRVLDIGAGIGKNMTMLKEAGFDVYGLEPSEQFRQKAIEKLNIDPDRLKHITVEDAQYEENYFDFITFGAVLEHLAYPGKSIENAVKWLKPNGIIQVEVPSSRYLIAKLINLYFRIIGTTFVTNLSPMHNPYHLYEFDLKTFEENAKKNNCQVVDYQYHVCSIPYFPNFTKPFINWIMKKTNTGLQLSICLKKIK